jgi:superfamily II DNA helicase RecQ
VRAWQEKGFNAVALTEETVRGDHKIFQKIRAGDFKLIFVSPERTLAKKGELWKLLQDDDFRALVRYVVVDEAHYMVTWGSSFRVDYANIGAIRPVLDGLKGDTRSLADKRNRIPVAVFTATASSDRILAITKAMNIKPDDCVRIHETTNRKNLFYAAIQIERGESKSYVCFQLKQDTNNRKRSANYPRLERY